MSFIEERSILSKKWHSCNFTGLSKCKYRKLLVVKASLGGMLSTQDYVKLALQSVSEWNANTRINCYYFHYLWFLQKHCFLRFTKSSILEEYCLVKKGKMYSKLWVKEKKYFKYFIYTRRTIQGGLNLKINHKTFQKLP